MQLISLYRGLQKVEFTESKSMKIYLFLRKIHYEIERRKKEYYLNGLKKKGLTIGKNVGIASDFFFDPSHCFLINIGDNCTIGPNVRLIAHDASTKKILGYTKIGKINIKENCFIGDSAIILPNVNIGPNSIIGAGSVVTKDIQANMVAAGNPAKIIVSIDEYIKKSKAISQNKKVFGKEYWIENLDESKCSEILRSIAEDIGFID